MAHRRRIQLQMIAHVEPRQLRHVFQILHYRLVHVIEQDCHRARRQLRHRNLLLIEMLRQTVEHFIINVLQPRHRAVLQSQFDKIIEFLFECRVVDDQNFGRRQSIELVKQLLIPIFPRIKIIKTFAGRNVRARQRNFFIRLERQHNVIIDGIMQSFIGQNGAGRDHFDHRAIRQTFFLRIAHLLDHRHLITFGDELFNVRIAGVVGHSAHGRAAPLSERQTQFL